MALTAIPPVRRPAPLRRGDPEAGRRGFASFFPGRVVHLCDSGTTALALALMDARLRHGSARPEAIVPAYGCPQLVSACLYASVRPRLVDTAPERWGYDLERLRGALSPDTVAVVAVNLLGVGDQARDILPLARANGSFLIQDSAQHLPRRGEADWLADYVVLSFGRGKPLNLLRGGALAIHADRPLLAAAPARATGAAARVKEAVFSSRTVALAFNTITHPWVFGIASRMPGLGLGDTRFEALHSLTQPSFAFWGALGPAFETYSSERWESPWTKVQRDWETLGIRGLTLLTSHPRGNGRQLRCALLTDDPRQRDLLIAALNRRGLGASAMYAVALGQVADIPADVAAQGPFPNASRLAERLFTLPTHASVTADVVSETDRCLRGVATRYEPALHS
jgi:dTDP-4-amino-4,6-dideoxygalactose transaminase